MGDNRTVFTPPVTLRRYYLPNVKGEGWGVFVIGSDGYFSAVSDYGNYAHAWSFAGMEFRAFLLQCDWHYVAKKISGGERGHWNNEKSLAIAKERIIARRRGDSLSKDDAREEWERTNALNWADEIEFVDWARDTKLDFETACACRVQEEFSAQTEAFAKILLPRLKALLRAELAAEAPSPAEKPSSEVLP